MVAICFSQQSVPPVMAFHLGSLGFLTPFEFDNFQEQVTNVLEGNVMFHCRLLPDRFKDLFQYQACFNLLS
jgi:NAD kinase